jgi:hypothetical protein
MFGKINSATPLEVLENRLEANATTMGSEIHANMGLTVDFDRCPGQTLCISPEC